MTPVEYDHFFRSLVPNPDHYAEAPDGFDYASEREAAIDCCRDLNELLDEQVSINPSVCQDAALVMWALVSKRGEPEALCPAIRFSTYGRLATIEGEELLSPGTVTAIQHHLERRGYRFVSTRVLLAAPKAGEPDLSDWWTRFFDYL